MKPDVLEVTIKAPGQPDKVIEFTGPDRVEKVKMLIDLLKEKIGE